MIYKHTTNEHDAFIELWEASVRAKQHPYKESDIEFYRPHIITRYLKNSDLYCIDMDNGKIGAFISIKSKHIELMTVHPDIEGIEMEKRLIMFAVEELGIQFLDVIEQNRESVELYKNLGFRIVGRSPLDAVGKPYPILHMIVEKGC